MPKVASPLPVVTASLVDVVVVESAAGATGDGAIYTDHGHAIHVIRMVILRVGAKVNYLVLKLH